MPPGAITIVEPVFRAERKGKSKARRKTRYRANFTVIQQLAGKVHARMHDIHKRLDQQHAISRRSSYRLKTSPWFSPSGFSHKVALPSSRARCAHMTCPSCGVPYRPHRYHRAPEVRHSPRWLCRHACRKIPVPGRRAAGNTRENSVMAQFEVAGESLGNAAGRQYTPAYFTIHNVSR